MKIWVGIFQITNFQLIYNGEKIWAVNLLRGIVKIKIIIVLKEENMVVHLTNNQWEDVFQTNLCQIVFLYLQFMIALMLVNQVMNNNSKSI